MKYNSLIVSREKLEQIVKGRVRVVSHLCTPRWERFLKKKIKTVRFIEYKFFDNITVEVLEVKKTVSLGETRIIIKLGKLL